MSTTLLPAPSFGRCTAEERRNTRVVRVFGNVYEVVRLSREVTKVFRREVVLVEDEHELNLVQS